MYLPVAARLRSTSAALLLRLSRAAARRRGRGMTLWRYILRGFLRALARGLRGDRARDRALHRRSRTCAASARPGASIGDVLRDHAAAGARGALPGVPAGPDAGEPRHLPALRAHQRARGDARRRRLGAAADRGAGGGGDACSASASWRWSIPSSPPRSSAALAVEDDFRSAGSSLLSFSPRGRLAAPGRPARARR